MACFVDSRNDFAHICVTKDLTWYMWQLESTNAFSRHVWCSLTADTGAHASRLMKGRSSARRQIDTAFKFRWLVLAHKQARNAVTYCVPGTFLRNGRAHATCLPIRGKSDAVRKLSTCLVQTCEGKPDAVPRCIPCANEFRLLLNRMYLHFSVDFVSMTSCFVF